MQVCSLEQLCTENKLILTSNGFDLSKEHLADLAGEFYREEIDLNKSCFSYVTQIQTREEREVPYSSSRKVV